MAHAFARAFAPQRDYRALAGRLQRADMLDHGFENIGAGGCAFAREIASRMGVDRDDVVARLQGLRAARLLFWRGEWSELREERSVEPLPPFTFGEIKPVRRQRLVRRAAAVLAERISSRLIIVGDLREPLMRGFFRQGLDGERRRWQIIEQRFKPAVK